LRGRTLLSGAALIALASAVMAAHATTAATDFVLPIWQGTSTSAPAAGHQIDCSSSNKYWDYACDLSIYAVTTGSNCAIEMISNPSSGVTGTNTYQNTSCIVKVDGFITMNQTAAGCVYGGGNAWLTTWQSGVNSTLISTSGTALTVLVKPTGTNTWLVTIKTVNPPTVNSHTIDFNERFVAKFNRSFATCPGPDVRDMKANLYDAFADLSINGRDGYLQDTVSAL
jgi:hypothetical protein